MLEKNDTKEGADSGARLLAHFAPVIERLKEQGVDYFVVTFDGSGDSGQIESVDAYDANGMVINVGGVSTPFERKESYFCNAQSRWAERRVMVEISLTNAIEECVYKMLENVGIDWYNNDGGFGDVRLKLNPLEIEANISQRQTSTTDYSYRETP